LDAFLYVQEEYDNVDRALQESLRFDYGPGQTDDYYDECSLRLACVKDELDRLRGGGSGTTSVVVAQLWDLANRLTLIERSHLGEFSWPFADAIRQIATALLSEDEGLKGKIDPIIHMIAEGTNYQILSENILGPNKRRRMFTVAFPRQLKHHVLMHALFGHELGHATFYSGGGREAPSKRIISILRREGPLRNCASAMSWLTSASAPPEVSERVGRATASLNESKLSHWLVELVCDLFGLMIFGPSFAAAHRTYLEPSCRSPFEIEIEKTSHPAYALRRNLLISALRASGWLTPVATDSHPLVRKAEEAFISYIGGDEFEQWASVFTEAQLLDSVDVIRSHFNKTGTRIAKRPGEVTLVALVKRIALHLPPIREEIDDAGISTTYEVQLEEQLYAGWAYWLGREVFESEKLSFFELNQLCDFALLHQQAIDIAAGRRPL
jgi:hypothetical protein